jgi:threonine dehydrogenase-like Zn-dependent dehydrogenase
MQGTILYGPPDVRIEERHTPNNYQADRCYYPDPHTCVDDLWAYRGTNTVGRPRPMGHEYCGIVEEVGDAVRSVNPGQFVIGSFFASDNTYPHYEVGYQTAC